MQQETRHRGPERRSWKWGILFCLGVALLGGMQSVPAADLNLINSGLAFNNPVGLDFQETPLPGRLIMSVFYSNGSPHNLEVVNPAGGASSQFSALANQGDELKIASVRASACQIAAGFTASEVFTGNNNVGQIIRISPDGSVVQNPWVTLPGETAVLRGSLFHDQFCVANGDLIVVTGNSQNGNPANDNVGSVWRVKANGSATLVRSLGTHLEGVITVPNNPIYGPLAGRILVGDEDRDVTQNPQNGVDGKLFALDPNTGQYFTIGHLGVTTCDLANLTDACHFHTAQAFYPEDLDLVRKNADFFAVDFGRKQLLKAPAADFAHRCGQIIITQEFPTPVTAPSGFYALRWDGTAFVVDALTSAINGIQWEHATFTGGEACDTPPQLKVEKTPDNSLFSQGNQVSFIMVVSNPAPAGASAATNVQLTDVLPVNGGLSWGTATTTQGSCVSPIVGNTLSCSLGTIAAGASVTVTVLSTTPTPREACRAQPNAAAIATADGGLTAQDSGFVTCVPVTEETCQVDVEKEVNPAVQGDPTCPSDRLFTYTYTVANNGSTLTSVSLTDDQLGLIAGPFAFLAGDQPKVFTKTACIMTTTTNIATVSGTTGTGLSCQDTDSATVTITDPGEGCSPGYWKQAHHFNSWVGYTPDTLFSTVFEANHNPFGTKTLLQVLQQGGGGINALGRHTVSALLNAAALQPNYGFTTAQVLSLFRGVYSNPPGTVGTAAQNALSALFAGMEDVNGRVCPLN